RGREGRRAAPAAPKAVREAAVLVRGVEEAIGRDRFTALSSARIAGSAVSVGEAVRDQPAAGFLIVEGERLALPVGGLALVTRQPPPTLVVRPAEVVDRPRIAPLAGALEPG